MLGPSATHAQILAERERLGLNDPLWVQYERFMSELFHGDLGTSIDTKKPVAYELGRRFPYTIQLALGATLVASFFGILFGIISAVRHNKLSDNVIMVTSVSYTHLDVYKRQPIACQRSFSRLGALAWPDLP